MTSSVVYMRTCVDLCTDDRSTKYVLLQKNETQDELVIVFGAVDRG